MNVAILAVFLAHVAKAQPADGIALMQSKLRGAKTTVPSPEEDEPVEPPKATPTQLFQNQYSDDDESCSAEGITPGICALASLARPAWSPTGELGEADCDKKESAERLERALIAEIEAALSGNHTGFDAGRLAELEVELQPTFSTLPQASGGLALAPARYLLHQHFLRQKSWYVRGLDPAGDGRKPPEEKEALRSRVAGHLLEVLEKKVAKGLDLKMLAVFVATLEHLLVGDQHERLKQAWAVHSFQSEATDAAGLTSVLEVFMAHYVYTSTKTESGYTFTLDKGRKEVDTIRKIYTGWPQVEEFIRQQLENRLRGAKSFQFGDAVKAADAVLLLFQEVSGSMCRDMMQDLSSFPGGNLGRVSLKDLRRKGSGLFRESDEYLRELGALDESLPGNPYLFLPNYMLGPSNCDGTTSFYDLCCPNECEVHKAHFERVLWETSSAAIVTEAAEERLGSTLPEKQKLKDPLALHGRDFAFWLHDVFPKACPMPRESDFAGEASVPDAKKEFQDATTALFDF